MALKKEMKIGLSNEDKQNMANEVYEKAEYYIDNRIDEGLDRLDARVYDFEIDTNEKIKKQDSAIQNLSSTSPKGVYASLSALQSTFPSGASGVYLTNDNGHWYYWDGSNWRDGGVYGSPTTEINERFQTWMFDENTLYCGDSKMLSNKKESYGFGTFLGNEDHPLLLVGSSTRPQYTDGGMVKELAFKSDFGNFSVSEDGHKILHQNIPVVESDNTDTYVMFGDADNCELRFRGTLNRPKYNNEELALKSDTHEVVANPTVTNPTELKTILIDGETFTIPSGSGGGGKTSYIHCVGYHQFYLITVTTNSEPFNHDTFMEYLYSGWYDKKIIGLRGSCLLAVDGVGKTCIPVDIYSVDTNSFTVTFSVISQGITKNFSFGKYEFNKDYVTEVV